MNLIEAINVVRGGGAQPHIERFIGLVKYAVATGQPVGFDIDDALIVSLVLQQLSESAEGRKILGLGKRKNTQFKARDFKPDSPQWIIANQYNTGELSKKQAIERMAGSFENPPDERTASRLLDDLCEADMRLRNGLEMELATIGGHSRDEALFKMLNNIAGSGSLEKILEGINRSTEKESRKAALRNEIEKLINASGHKKG